MSTHSHHRAHRRPLRKRTKTLVIGVVAMSLTGAAYSAHATFGRDRSNVHTDVAITPVELTPHGTGLHAKKATAPEATGFAPTPWWPTRSWPTRTNPTQPTTTPRPTRTTTPSTTTPTTTRPTRTTPSTTTPTTTTPTTTPPTTPPPTGGNQSWPGYVPGKFYLGMSCGTICAAKESALGRDYGVHRQFKDWGAWSAVGKVISQDHKADRLPWVSVKGPSGGTPAGWRALASGSYDADIRALATVLKANDDSPVLLTFNHEPSNDGTEADGAAYAAAYSRFHDVLKQAGALANVADPPILGDWLFNPRNKTQDPANWLTSGLLSRAPFIGIDMYQNSSGDTFADRIPAIKSWLSARGYPNMMIGIGETGSTDHYAGTTAVKWMNDSLSWVAAHVDQVAVVSYFNSMNNARAGVYWPLDESAAKMAAYRTWLADSKSID